MHISGTTPVPPQISASGKSKDVPPGLFRRGLDLPPGIARKLAAGGTPPPGILKRFPAATPTPEPTPPAPDAVSGAGIPNSDGSSNTTPSIDIVA
jgi:hypothetical protein